MITETLHSKEPRKTVVQLLALTVLLEETPQYFRSDEAFLCETTHAYLRGSTARAARKFRSFAARPIAVTRYIKKKDMLELGRWLCHKVIYFGVVMFRNWSKPGPEIAMSGTAGQAGQAGHFRDICPFCPAGPQGTSERDTGTPGQPPFRGRHCPARLSRSRLKQEMIS